jgi:hypothetical protein
MVSIKTITNVPYMRFVSFLVIGLSIRSVAWLLRRNVIPYPNCWKDRRKDKPRGVSNIVVYIITLRQRIQTLHLLCQIYGKVNSTVSLCSIKCKIEEIILLPRKAEQNKSSGNRRREDKIKVQDTDGGRTK